jgi:hypothetical protein
MTLFAKHFPAEVMTVAVIGDLATSEKAEPARVAGRAGEEGASSLFGQLVTLYKSNDVLLSQLKSVHLKLNQAQTYRLSASRNPALAEAHLSRLRTRHSVVLTLLRANRLQARAFLARLEAPTGGVDELSPVLGIS